MTADELRKKYLDFFVKKGHKVILSASLVPENDPTTLFVSAGMQPMLPYLLGETHPQGTRIVDVQKCVRTGDIEEVGDNRHQTLFEMLGNWSFGDYFKKEQLTWIFEFLINEIKLDPKRIYVTVFSGNKKYHLAKDTESVEIWKDLFAQQNIEAKDIELGSVENATQVGMQGGRIFYYDQKKNWWSRSGSIEAMPSGEPGGPNSEMFYEFPEIEHDPKYGKFCHPNCDCGRFLEFGNSVFMQYKKQADDSLEELPSKNVDYGGGLERLIMVKTNQPDVFQTDLFLPAIQKTEEVTNKKYNENLKEFRIFADHIRASVFIIADGIEPSNKDRGYILRRLIRRSVMQLKNLSVADLEQATKQVAEIFIEIMSPTYPELKQNTVMMIRIIRAEVIKFNQTLDKGLKEFNKRLPEMKTDEETAGKIAFDLYQTYGFPVEETRELLEEQGLVIDLEGFLKAFKNHQELSRTSSAGMFKGGLTEQSEITTKYHTATHLLHAALRQVLGNHVEQKGSNITTERLRFDFSNPEKLTDQQIKEVENLVNQKIKEDLPVTSEVMDKEEALKSGALGFFTEKYGDKVTVYKIGNPSTSSGPPFSREVCGGPHVESTAKLGTFKIIKEESASSGIRRIYGTLSF